MIVFTTSEVAKFCKVSTQTASRWVDNGQLPGWRVPFTKHRRVSQKSLIKFMRDNGLPEDLIKEVEEVE